ncbi:hypothetical protein [Verrucomicrobium spinosum]|uniref:hypothetical protein n=1 Tax=Verrucomicrobium spinosum TaxID=2736 RepID=UPI003CCDA5A8
MKRAGQVHMERTCALHGDFSACLASDERFYWLAQGSDENRVVPAAPAGPVARQRGHPQARWGAMPPAGRRAPLRCSPPVWRSSRSLTPATWPAPPAMQTRPSAPA